MHSNKADTKQDIYMKDVILALPQGSRKWQKSNACEKYQLYSNQGSLSNWAKLWDSFWIFQSHIESSLCLCTVKAERGLFLFSILSYYLLLSYD